MSSAAVAIKVMLMIVGGEVDGAVAAAEVLLRLADLVVRARAHLAGVPDLRHVVPVPGLNRRRHVRDDVVSVRDAEGVRDLKPAGVLSLFAWVHDVLRNKVGRAEVSKIANIALSCRTRSWLKSHGSFSTFSAMRNGVPRRSTDTICADKEATKTARCWRTANSKTCHAATHRAVSVACSTSRQSKKRIALANIILEPSAKRALLSLPVP